MNPPLSPKPFTVIDHPRTIKFGTVDLDQVASLMGAMEKDKARHVVEWLEYELYMAKKKLADLRGNDE